MGVLLKFAQTASAEPLEIEDEGTFARAFGSVTLGAGLYWGWLYLTILCIPFLLGGESGSTSIWWIETLSLLGYLAMACLCFLLPKAPLDRLCAKPAIGTATTVVALCSALIAAKTLSFPIPDVPLYIGAVGTGLGTGLFMAAWGRIYARSIRFSRLQVGCALVVSAATCLIVIMLPPYALVACMFVLPIAFGLCYAVSFDNAPVEDEEGKSDESETVQVQPRWAPFPWRACLSLLAIGTIYSLIYNLAAFWIVPNPRTSLAFIAVSLAVGIAILAYTIATKRNFGFSMANAAIIPLTGTGLLVFAMFHQSGFLLAFVLVRGAYVLFDMIMWLQLPRILRATGDVRAFIASRISLSAGEAVGAFVVLFMNGNFLFFDTTLVIAGAVMFAAFALASANGGAVQAWGLLPQAKESRHRLRSACAAIAETYKLTNREAEVLELMARGKNGPYIADKLCISMNTYQSHTRNLYRKMDAHTRAEVLKLVDESIYAAKNAS